MPCEVSINMFCSLYLLFDHLYQHSIYEASCWDHLANNAIHRSLSISPVSFSILLFSCFWRPPSWGLEWGSCTLVVVEEFIEFLFSFCKWGGI